MDVYALELVVKKLRGRKKEQRLAISDKQRANLAVQQHWERLVAWCQLPVVSAAPGLQALASAIIMPKALEAVRKQHFPWAGGGGLAGGKGPRMEAALGRCYREMARSKEELKLIEEEIDRALVYYEQRVAVLKLLMEGEEAGSGSTGKGGRSHMQLLAFHHARNAQLLAGFQALKRGEVPRDKSRMPVKLAE